MKNLKNYQIQLNDVLSAYSGKLGCMCGCNGKYNYSSLNRELSSKDRGYEVTDEDVNDKAVKRMVNKFNNLGQVSIDVDDKGKPNNYIFVETETRMNCIYLKSGTLDNVKID